MDRAALLALIKRVIGYFAVFVLVAQHGVNLQDAAIAMITNGAA